MSAVDTVRHVLERHEQLNSFGHDPDVPLDQAPAAACTCTWRGDDHQQHLAEVIVEAVSL